MWIDCKDDPFTTQNRAETKAEWPLRALVVDISAINFVARVLVEALVLVKYFGHTGKIEETLLCFTILALSHALLEIKYLLVQLHL